MRPRTGKNQITIEGPFWVTNPQIWPKRRVAESPDTCHSAGGLRAGGTSPRSAVHAASSFRERCASFKSPTQVIVCSSSYNKSRSQRDQENQY